MCAEVLYSVDRIEGDKAVLMAEDGAVCVVPLTDLPNAKAGTLYRKEGDCFVRDTVAEMAKRERIRVTQQRVRQPK